MLERKRYIKALSFLNAPSFPVFILSILVTIASFITVTAPFPALAQSICDAEHMDAIESRAWLEAQRDIAQNKNIVSKPDSVLEYTCFNRYASVLAATADTMFSDEHEGVNRVPEMLDSLDVLVENSLSSYLSANFGHTFIDNRSFIPTFSNNISNSSFYICTALQTVWDASQCLDFQNRNRDRYYTLDWYVNNDPRMAIDGCSPAGGTGAYLNSAYNNNNQLFSVNNGAPFDGTDYQEDPLQSFLNLTELNNCGVPIPTGLVVQRDNYDPTSYCDFVCSNPGCYYDPPNTVQTSCQSASAGSCQK